MPGARDDFIFLKVKKKKISKQNGGNAQGVNPDMSTLFQRRTLSEGCFCSRLAANLLQLYNRLNDTWMPAANRWLAPVQSNRTEVVAPSDENVFVLFFFINEQ